jgi:putative ATPase
VVGAAVGLGVSDLWAGKREAVRAGVAPLALRMRPRNLEEFEGQEHILGEGRLLRRMLEADVITSVIFHGPPGTGKTTLAELVAVHTRRHFERENAASVGVKKIREIIDAAAHRLEVSGRRTILFLDEIHRFSKAQQDVLLGDVERGIITLIGATTENPMFACNSALVSRSTLFRLEAMSERAIINVVKRAIADPERGYGGLGVRATDGALGVWAVKSDGDARRALTALEVAVESEAAKRKEQQSSRTAEQQIGEATRRPSDEGAEAPVSRLEAQGCIEIDRAAAEDSIQQKAAVYDGTGDEHYDVISAMIKSVRGSDPDAAVYWVARMLDAGEDPRYIARRLAILASEDIGNADPRAVMVAGACWQLVERIGMPECRITLSQCAIYLALAPKSNASYVAIEEAMADVREGRTVPVPVFLRDPHSGTLQGETSASGGGERYEYSHDSPNGVSGQDYLGVPKCYYRPTDRGVEKVLGERLEAIRRRRSAGRG